MTTPSPLHDAAQAGNLQEITRLLNTGVDINQRDRYGQTALFRASWYGHLEVVTLLLDRGASIDLQSENGYTALITASANGCAKIVSLLLERGANYSIKTKHGKTALDYARSWNKPDCVAILQNYEHFHRYRKAWLSFSTSLSSSQEDQNQESNQDSKQFRSPSLRRMKDSSDLVRYVTEFM